MDADFVQSRGSVIISWFRAELGMKRKPTRDAINAMMADAIRIPAPIFMISLRSAAIITADQCFVLDLVRRRRTAALRKS
jgi:hypothetical protein